MQFHKNINNKAEKKISCMTTTSIFRFFLLIRRVRVYDVCFHFFFYIQMLWIEIRRFLFSDDFVCLCHITNFSNRQIITNWNFLFCFVFAPLFEIFDDLRKFKFFDWKIFFLKSVYSMFGSLHGFFLIRF